VSLQTVNAFQAGLAKLYHYQPFNPEHIADLLTRNRIHCSTPGKLNDPWDCQLCYDSDSLKDPAVREQYIDWLSQLVGGFPASECRTALEVLLKDPEGLTKSIEGLARTAQQETSKRRIYCLTPHPDSILMWSHYSNNHSGICLEFQTANPLFSSAMKVIYLSHYPKFLPHEMGIGQAFQVLLTKSEAWSYEEEYRIVGIPQAPPGAPMQLDSDWINLPHGALAAVILGCQADQKQIERFFKGHAPHLPLRKAVRVGNQYRLTITD
jgi:hypothetical protein